MKFHRHNARAALAAGLVFAAVAAAGCMSSTYSVELPAPASAGGPAPADTNAYAQDIPALTRAVDWDKVPVAAMTEGF